VSTPLEVIGHLRTVDLCQTIHHEKPDIVAGLLVLLPRITEAYNEFDVGHNLI